MCLGITRSEPNRAGEAFGGLLPLALAGEESAEIVGCFGEVRLQPQCRLVMRQRLARAALLVEQRGQ